MVKLIDEKLGSPTFVFDDADELSADRRCSQLVWGVSAQSADDEVPSDLLAPRGAVVQ